MIIPPGGPEKAQEVKLSKVHHVCATYKVEQTTRRDAVTISGFSSLVETGRKQALSLPDTRADRVEEARASIDNGDVPVGIDIASAMVDRAEKGLV